MAARTRKPRHLLKGAAAPLDGVAAMLKRAADRLNAASAYAGDGATVTAFDRFVEAILLADSALKELQQINEEHTR